MEQWNTLLVFQVFVQPWSTDVAHQRSYTALMRRLRCLVGPDAKLALLFQLVALFYSVDVPVRDKHAVVKAQVITYKEQLRNGPVLKMSPFLQESMAYLLQRYLSSTKPGIGGVTVFARLMQTLSELRAMADRIRDNNVNIGA